MKNRIVLLWALMALMASATFTACQKEEEADSYTFFATMEDCTDRQDKTTLVNNRLFWERGDEVMIYGSSGNGVYTAVPDAHNATQAQFVGNANLGGAPYYAIYPASIAVSSTSVNLPAVQVSPDGSPKGLPMYEKTNSRNLHLYNLCGLLRLHLTKADVTISSITFVAETGTSVSGGFSVDYNNGSPRLTPTNGRNWVRLQCTTPQSIATGGDFYLYLPEGNYQNFRFEIRTSDGQICVKASAAPKTLVIERSYCTTITLGSSHLTFVPDTPAELVDGWTFNDAIPRNATAVVFEYNSPVSSGTLLSTSDSPYPIYGNRDGTTWRVSTAAYMMNANPDCSWMFAFGWWNVEPYPYPYLERIDFGEGFNTSNVTNMLGMFGGCSSLTSLDLSHFNTSNVTYMSRMFSGCSGLTSLDLSNFNTSSVTNMGGMFEACGGLTSLDVSSFNTSSVINMNGMFNACRGLTNLDVSNFNTENVTDMSRMFGGCSGLTNLDVTHFNTSNVTDMQAMFYNCSGLTSLDLSNFNTSNITDMRCMFYGCRGLTSLDLSNFNTSNVTDMQAMFYNCSGLTSLDLSHFNTSNVTDMFAMFSMCAGLTSLDLSNFDMSNVIYKGGMCYHLSITSGHCTITCTEAIQPELQSGTELPTSRVTFTWQRPASSK